MWPDERRTYRPRTNSGSHWWIAAALVVGVLIGMRIAGGPHYFASALKPSPTPASISPPATRVDRPGGIGLERAPVMTAPVGAPSESRRAGALPAPATRDIFYCKGYGGQTFWSNVTCSQQGAMIERIVTVPGQMGWNDAVVMGEQNRRAAESLYTPAGVVATAGAIGGNASSTSSNSNACQALAAFIEQLDATARQPQSPQTQDQLRRERQQARDRQSALHC